MGWKEILGRREAAEPEPSLVDRQQILAYLEELSRLRTPCQLKFHREDLAPAHVKVESVAEEAESFTVSLSRALPPGVEEQPALELTFPLDRGRFRCSVLFQQRGGYLQAVLGLPLRIKPAERRFRPRARFGARERASVTLLESLGDGIGAAGKVRNLSMDGLAFRVDRMLSIRDDKRMTPTAGHFTAGQKVLLVRINDLPRAPMVECGGVIAYATTTPEGPLVGVQFEGIGALETQVLEGILRQRLPKSGQLFPVRQRRSHMDLEAGARQASEDEEEFEDPELESETDAGEKPLPSEGLGPATAEDPWPDRSDPKERVQRLKRAGRTLLLLMGDDLDRAILAGTLAVDGFRRVREARNFTAALDCLAQSPPDLVLLDQRIGGHDAQLFLERLRRQGLGADVPIVLLAEKCDVKTTLMAKAARICHVQVKPVDYDGSLRGVLERLLMLG